MTKDEARQALRELLSTGPYEETNRLIEQRIAQIDHVDVSDCKDRWDVWERTK